MRHFTLLVLIIALCSACSIKKRVQKRLDTKLAKENLTQKQISQDIDYYNDMVQKISPFPYLFTDKQYIDSISISIKNEKQLTSIEFYEKFITLQGAYNVPHMYSYYPKKQYAEYSKKYGFFPVKCTFKNNKLTVVQSYLKDNPLKKDDHILKINGRNADSLFTSFYKYIGGMQEYKKKGIQSSFGMYLWLNKIYSPFIIEASSQNRTGVYTFTSNGYKPSAKQKNVKSEKISFDNIIQYRIINDSVGLITFNSMIVLDQNKFNMFLTQTFKDIQQKRIKMLFIDMRQNHGGSSHFGKLLIDHFTEKSYRMASEKKWKVSQEYKDNFRRMLPWYIRKIAIKNAGLEPYFKHKNNVLYENGNGSTNNLHKPSSIDYRFSGKVYMIISNNTFSSAMMTANAVQDFELATLVGEPTGACPNELGEIVPIRLKNSGITCWIPSALFTRANGDINNTNPVLPDIPIENVNELSINSIIEIALKKDK